MRGWLFVLVGCGGTPAAPSPRPPEPSPASTLPALDAAMPAADPSCIGGDCADGAGVRWTWLGDLHALEVGRFEASRLVTGDLFLTSRDTYQLAVDGRTAVLERPGYRIVLAIDDHLPWQGRVMFPDGDRIGIEWRDGITGICEGVNPKTHRDIVPPSITDEHVTAAILVADDLAAGPFSEHIEVKRLDTEPPLVAITQLGTEYIARIGVVQWWSAHHSGVACVTIAWSCELEIEGPAGTGIAKFDNQRLIARPALITQQRHAWKDIVPGRLARARAALIECEHAVAEVQGALGPTGELAPAREAADRAVAQLRDAADAIDDAHAVLPLDRLASARLEALRDDVTEQLVRLALLDAALAAAEPRAWGELRQIATLPDIARLRVDLTKLRL